ncbi:MAG: hypothetical protein V1839_01925 [archaeon]
MEGQGVQHPHELFSLCDKISKNMAGIKTFVTKNGYSIQVMCFAPNEPKMHLSIRKGGLMEDNTEEDISLFYDTHKCKYEVICSQKSLVARSISRLESEECVEEPPFRDWIKWILDGAYEALVNSTRINPYTREVLPFFEETEHDDYLRATIHSLNETSESLRQKLEEGGGKPGIYQV